MTALVLIHAFPFNGGMWEHQRRALRDAAEPMLAPNLPGFGGTAVRRGQPTMDDYADAVIEAMDAASVERAAIAGLSLGGYVAFALWRRHRDRVDRLMLADTRADADTDEARERRTKLATLVREQGVEALVRTPPAWLREGSPYWDEIKAVVLKQPADAVAQASIAMGLRPDSRPLLADIDVPTAVVVGELDTITPPDLARAMSDAIPAATLTVIPAAGHLANIDAPTAFDAALRAWLRRTA